MRYLPQPAAAIADKLRAGGELRLHRVRRRTNTALRLGFSPTDTVALQSVEPLLARGIAVLGPDGTIRHGGK
ncbi:MAG: hypothetical protein KDK07_21930 [Bauldia sp.]|nr:hypothetical protein [Bauldia sp.]